MNTRNPLEAVRKVRDQCRDEAAGRLAARLREVGPIEIDLQQLETALEVLQIETSEVRSVLYETAEGGSIEVAEIERRHGAWAYLEGRLRDLRGQIQERRLELEVARKRVREAREELEEAARACQVIERLDEQREARLRVEEKRTEERALGELAAAAWIAAGRECRELERPAREPQSKWGAER